MRIIRMNNIADDILFYFGLRASRKRSERMRPDALFVVLALETGTSSHIRKRL